MKSLKRPLTFLACAFAAATVMNGCCTKKLWQSEAFNDHYEPAPQANASLFYSRGQDDVLVVYDEEREVSGKIHRRAYWLQANQGRIQRLKKPQFVSPKLTEGMEPLLLGHAGATNVLTGEWAELSPTGNGFTLVEDGQTRGKYIFPVYQDKSGEVKRWLLMPGAVTADTAIIGGTLGIVYLYSNRESIYPGY